ncbi:adhesion G-protein coupled receptor G2-like [Syngnathus typhle]|uniref:adhesion G-protein coupled receptor G2-like n=1 Tax=Syngnathus typhle TaxID=161592 RepID=UPI002A6AD132|nr:adhesion G-protein coupled receptor G2-like [Syngnathus typhle]
MDPRSTKSIKRRRGCHSDGRWRCAYVLLQVLGLSFLGSAPVPAFGYFLGDTKAVLDGCEDHWTLQDGTSMPVLLQMSVCLDVRVLSSGDWVAFSYSSVHAPRPELGLEGNEGAVYGWLLGVRHRFPVSLSLARWHTVCLRRDVPGNSFSLELNGRLVAKRTVIAQAVPPSGSLWLGCRPRRQPRGAAHGQVEVYMFRVWADLAQRGPCEDGTVIGWSARFWGVTSPRARETDHNLHCAQIPEFGPSFSPPPVSTSIDSHPQSEILPVTVTSSGHGEKTSSSTPSPPVTPPPSATTSLDINVAFAMTTSDSTPIIRSLPQSLAPPTDHSPANHISSSTVTPHEMSNYTMRATADSLLPSASNALNVTTISVTTHHIKDTSHSNLTTTSSPSDYNVTTHPKGSIHLPNDTMVNTTSRTLIPSTNPVENITTGSEITLQNTPKSHSTMSHYSVTTRKAFSHLPNNTTFSDFSQPNNTLEHDATTISGITLLIKNTSRYNAASSTPGYNVTESTLRNITSDLLQPLENNVATESLLIKDTSPYNLTSWTPIANVSESKANGPAVTVADTSISTDALNRNVMTNPHSGSRGPTTSNNVTEGSDRTAEATGETIVSITSSNHEATPTESTRNDSQARVDLSTRLGVSRELFATTTTAETLQTTNVGLESSSSGIGKTTTLSSGTKKNLEERADKLLESTWDVSQLNSSQVARLVAELEKLLDAPGVSQALAKKVVGIISNLMEGNTLALAPSSNRIIRVVEDLGLKLLVSDTPAVLSSNSLVLAVRKVEADDFPEMSVDIFNTEHVQMSDGGGGTRKRDSTLASVYLPRSITDNLSGDERKQVDRVQFTFYTKAILFQDDTLTKQTAVSPVLASSVSNVSIGNLTDKIRFTVRNSRAMHANNEAVCCFWDFALNGGAGGWSSAGCSLVSATSWTTTCACNHLTSFAVLLDLSRSGLDDPRQAQILTFITYIGCGVSAIFLAATLLTYLSFGKLLRDIPAKILVQLCFSLLLLNLAYLLDGWLATYPYGGLCIGAAFFLHYFLLTSFTWAGLEALHMYLSIVRVFTPYLSRYMLKFSLIGWGVPAAVVVVVISVDKDNYGPLVYGRDADGSSGDFCWLRSDAAFYAGVAAYFLLVLASCLLVFGVVMAQLRRIKKQNPQHRSPQRGPAADLRSVAGLVALLGLAWGFALFAWGPLRLPFVYLFSIFNSLQGFFLFVFHCACKENVRRQWRTFLCCGNLRLAENSDWSRTAARDKRNFSVSTSGVSSRRPASRSSSLASTNASGSVFADSGVSEVSSGDVVLNELHRQTVLF